MIKVAIFGADSPKGGELARILLNHPEVEMTALVAPGQEGKNVTAVHHGFYGEEPLYFTSIFPSPKDTDVLFVASGNAPAEQLASLKKENPDLITIFMEPSEEYRSIGETPVYGLPEINRKPLVRGATAAVIPSPPASATLVALYPLAVNMILNSSLRIEVTMPEDMMGAEIRKAENEIEEMLVSVQKSFEKKIELPVKPSPSTRSMEIDIDLDCSINLEHILELYDMYDDHRFAFPVSGRLSCSDIKATQKCLFTISKPSESTLHIQGVADPRMRGGAGEAVHVMNLLCGLHEKTGLGLKTSDFIQMK